MAMDIVILEHRAESKDTKHVEGVFFRCHQCEETKPVKTEGGTGYASDDAGYLICYSCCGKNDVEWMKDKGRITLYLVPSVKTAKSEIRYSVDGKVTNWPGTLEFKCWIRTSRHNMARVRYDCWFDGPDGFVWHGVTCGDNTQICHCKRTKTPSKRSKHA